MDQTLKEMNTYQTTSTCRYNLNFFKRSMLILLLLCISFMIPGISLTALGADVTEPGKSYLLDNLSYPSDNTLNKRPSLVRDIIAKSGETGVGNNVADVDMSFGDLWENFDVGGQAHIEFWWKKFILFVDPTYIVLNADIIETKIIGSLRSNLKVKMFMLDMAAGYRVANIPLGKSVRSDAYDR